MFKLPGSFSRYDCDYTSPNSKSPSSNRSRTYMLSKKLSVWALGNVIDHDLFITASTSSSSSSFSSTPLRMSSSWYPAPSGPWSLRPADWTSASPLPSGPPLPRSSARPPNCAGRQTEQTNPWRIHRTTSCCGPRAIHAVGQKLGRALTVNPHSKDAR